MYHQLGLGWQSIVICLLPVHCRTHWLRYGNLMKMKMMLKMNMKAKDEYEYEDDEVLVEDEGEE